MNGNLRKVIMYAIDLSERSNAISDMFHNVLSQINSVASDILDVSSQTNMLSLNASVEAARAGENGKSFAVVASEVKELAFKASDLSNEIAELVVDTQTRIDQLKTIDDKKSALKLSNLCKKLLFNIFFYKSAMNCISCRLF